MCLIVAPRKPDGHLVLTEDQLKQAFARNSDGWGFMWLETDEEGGEVIQRMRGLQLDEFLAAYEALKGERGLHLHLRTRTHGKTDVANCHPFPIGEDSYLMHNGVFRIDDIFSDRSDTWHYAALTSARLMEFGSTDPIFDNEDWQKSTAKFFGSSKGVFLRADGKRFIANESSGTWFEEQWYSNTGGAPWTYTRSFTTGYGNYVYMGADRDAGVLYRSYADGTWEDDKTPAKGTAVVAEVKQVVGQLFAGWRNGRNKTPCGFCTDGNGTAKCLVCDERVCTNCREWIVEERAHICLDCMAKLMVLEEEKTDATKTDDRDGGVGQEQQQGAGGGEVGATVGEDPQRVG